MRKTTTNDIASKARAFPLTLLRVGVGFVMTVHGWDKLTALAPTQQQFAALGIPMADLAAYLAIAAELLGGLGLIVGLFTPIAALGVLCVMLTAVLIVHLPNGLLMKNNGFEYPMIVGLNALYFAIRGGGPWSVDAWLRANKNLPEWLPLGHSDSQVHS